MSAPPGSGSWLRSFKAVAWSFFGVRRSVDQADDIARLKPAHVLAAAVVAGLIFVLVLVAVVHWVVGSGAAAGP